ncbi:ankyrin repeat ph and sec7 domain containing protein secg-related [Anaeramoeba ignava]|uniref:Ankyrin repeat ph and sec7 domain containing protein secg-related n=1 Tax=Anaeramoeba ignava TaxID=1746090 RepID=A0A9Q0RFS2_ANAIG|nr:ankyrin repeat ph and sec7 domain containing protein secg-related [Anaeramoeba ignava]
MNQNNIWEIIKENNIEKLKEIKNISENELIKENKLILHFAIEKQVSKEIIEELISKGANPKLTDKLGRNSLHISIINNSSLEIIELLISKGIDINSKTNDNKETVLHYACRYNSSLEIIEYLISKGININSKTNDNLTALHLACRYNLSLEIIQYLVEKGIDINSKTDDNETALHYAFEKGIDINSKTNKNETVLHLICRYNSPIEIIQYLISKGIDINAKTNKNETALHYACEYNSSLEIIQYLISKGIDINSKTNDNQTALSILIDEKRKDLIEFMIMNDANIFDLKQNQITNELIELFLKIYSINQDMNQLLNSNDNFSDLVIQSKDGFKFNLHKLILLKRFDNNIKNLNKFIINCSKKSKEYVENVVNFVYTGFPNLNQIYQNLIQDENESENENEDEILNLNENENEVEEFFKEIGFDSNWINSKKGRKGIIKDLSKLYQENETKDFKIIIEKKEIKVHKLILIIRSELFKGMFLNVQDSSNQVHDYSQKSFSTIHQLIYFLYHDKFEEKQKKQKKHYKSNY